MSLSSTSAYGNGSLFDPAWEDTINADSFTWNSPIHNSRLEYNCNDLSSHQSEHEEERDGLSEWALNRALQPEIDFSSADVDLTNDASFDYSILTSLPFSEELSLADNLSSFDVEAITIEQSDIELFDFSGLDIPQLSISSSSSPLLSHDGSKLNATPPTVGLLQEPTRALSARPSSLPLSRAPLLKCPRCARRFLCESRLR